MWRLLLNSMTKKDRKTDNFILPVYKVQYGEGDSFEGINTFRYQRSHPTITMKNDKEYLKLYSNTHVFETALQRQMAVFAYL